jgi:hypothetical protein
MSEQNNISLNLQTEIRDNRRKEIKRHIDGLPVSEVEQILNDVLVEVKETTTYTLQNQS